jgi:hypothetical protein
VVRGLWLWEDEFQAGSAAAMSVLPPALHKLSREPWSPTVKDPAEQGAVPGLPLSLPVAVLAHHHSGFHLCRPCSCLHHAQEAAPGDLSR